MCDEHADIPLEANGTVSVVNHHNIIEEKDASVEKSQIELPVYNIYRKQKCQSNELLETY